jgi:hypothetical protein
VGSDCGVAIALPFEVLFVEALFVEDCPATIAGDALARKQQTTRIRNLFRAKFLWGLIISEVRTQWRKETTQPLRVKTGGPGDLR